MQPELSLFADAPAQDAAPAPDPAPQPTPEPIPQPTATRETTLPPSTLPAPQPALREKTLPPPVSPAPAPIAASADAPQAETAPDAAPADTSQEGFQLSPTQKQALQLKSLLRGSDDLTVDAAALAPKLARLQAPSGGRKVAGSSPASPTNHQTPVRPSAGRFVVSGGMLNG